MEVPLASVEMTDQPTPQAPPAASEKRGDAKALPRYERAVLAEYLGVSPAAVAGALADSDKQTFTIAEAEKAVRAFYDHEDTSEMAQPDPEPEGEEE